MGVKDVYLGKFDSLSPMKLILTISILLFSYPGYALQCDSFLIKLEGLPFGKILQQGVEPGVKSIPQVDFTGVHHTAWGNRITEGSIITGDPSINLGGPQRVFRFSMNGFLPVEFAELAKAGEVVIYGKIENSVPETKRGLTGHESNRSQSLSDHFEIESLEVKARIWPHTRKFEIRFKRNRLSEVFSPNGVARLLEDVLNGPFKRNSEAGRSHRDPHWKTFHYSVPLTALHVYALVLGKTTHEQPGVLIDKADLGTFKEAKKLLEGVWGLENLNHLHFFNGEGAMMSHSMHPSLNKRGPIPLLGSREPDLESWEMYQGQEIDYFNREHNPLMGPWNLDHFEYGP